VWWSAPRSPCFALSTTLCQVLLPVVAWAKSAAGARALSQPAGRPRRGPRARAATLFGSAPAPFTLPARLDCASLHESGRQRAAGAPRRNRSPVRAFERAAPDGHPTPPARAPTAALAPPVAARHAHRAGGARPGGRARAARACAARECGRHHLPRVRRRRRRPLGPGATGMVAACFARRPRGGARGGTPPAPIPRRAPLPPRPN
jgi:hypothetical protein